MSISSTSQKTYQPSAGSVPSDWYVVDAKGQTLGRLAVNVARILRGKHRPQFTPHLNTGEHIIVVNAKYITVTGDKRENLEYDRYSGYPSGRRLRTFQEALDRDPTFPITKAIKGMLQPNSLGADMLKRLRVYAEDTHDHVAQKPTPIKFGKYGELIRLNGN